jgi:hypothetical protein
LIPIFGKFKFKKIVSIFRRKQFKNRWLSLAGPPSKDLLGYKTSIRKALFWLMGVALVAPWAQAAHLHNCSSLYDKFYLKFF